MNSSQRILEIIVENINNKKITEKDCLIACDINYSFLTQWKNGKIKLPSYDKIVKLAQYLEIDLDYLFYDKKIQKDVFSEDKQRLLEMYDLLTEREQGEILGELKTLIRNKLIAIPVAARYGNNEIVTENVSQDEIEVLKNAKAQKY